MKRVLKTPIPAGAVVSAITFACVVALILFFKLSLEWRSWDKKELLLSLFCTLLVGTVSATMAYGVYRLGRFLDARQVYTRSHRLCDLAVALGFVVLYILLRMAKYWSFDWIFWGWRVVWFPVLLLLVGLLTWFKGTRSAACGIFALTVAFVAVLAFLLCL